MSAPNRLRALLTAIGGRYYPIAGDYNDDIAN